MQFVAVSRKTVGTVYDLIVAADDLEWITIIRYADSFYGF